MSEVVRERDVIVHYKGDAYPVRVSDEMRTRGWAGGQGVQWVDDPASTEFVVTYSDGLYGGFLLWGSSESGDDFTTLQLQQPTYGYAVFCAGGWLISTSTYERYTYASRTGGGPLVPIPYQARTRLVLSLRGLWTPEDEWTLSGDPRGANGYFLGNVVQAPSVKNKQYLVVQTSI